MRNICFYHAGCPDGFGAAWAVRNEWGVGGRYVPIGHEDRIQPETYEGDVVAFVDIAPPNETLRALSEVAAQVIVLDHHVSARDRYEADPSIANVIDGEGHHIHFDLSHSGAVLAWQHFGRDEPIPDLLLYVEDQDVWNWKLPFSEEVNAAVASYPHRFEVWSELAERPIDELAQEGAPIVRANRMEVERALHNAHPLVLGTRRIEAVNSTHSRSAIGHELAKRAAFGKPWGCVYRLIGHRVHATLYSIGDLDVSVIAGEFGGGGHRNAAGFSVQLDVWLSSFL